MSSIIALRRRAALKKQNTNEKASKNIIAHYSDEPITSIIEKKLPESIEKPNIKDDDADVIDRKNNSYVPESQSIDTLISTENDNPWKVPNMDMDIIRYNGQIRRHMDTNIKKSELTQCNKVADTEETNHVNEMIDNHVKQSKNVVFIEPNPGHNIDNAENSTIDEPFALKNEKSQSATHVPESYNIQKIVKDFNDEYIINDEPSLDIIDDLCSAPIVDENDSHVRKTTATDRSSTWDNIGANNYSGQSTYNDYLATTKCHSNHDSTYSKNAGSIMSDSIDNNDVEIIEIGEMSDPFSHKETEKILDGIKQPNEHTSHNNRTNNTARWKDSIDPRQPINATVTLLDIEREKNKSLNNISNDNKMIKTSIYPQDDIEIDNEIITAMESGDISDKILKNEKLKMTHARINDAKISPEIKGVMRSLAAYGYNEDNCPPITQTMGPMETIEDRSTFLELMHTIIVANFKSLLKTPKQSSNIDSNSTQYHSRRRYRGEHVLGGQHGNMPTKGRTYQMGQNPRSR